MLLLLFLFYFVAKPFYQLAELYNKSKWGFGILSVVVFYSGAFVTGIIIAIISPDSVDTMNSIVMSLISIPLGLAFVWILYKILEYNWSKTPDNYTEGDILDQNLNNPNQSI